MSASPKARAARKSNRKSNRKSASRPAAPLHTPEVQTLLQTAEMEAERTVSVARMAAAAGLFLLLAVVIPSPEEQANTILTRQGDLAMFTMFAYFVVGLLAWLLLRIGGFRRWMLVPLILADVFFVVASVWNSMQNTNLMGDTVFLYPSVWLVPLVLSFGVLRGNPKVMAGTALALVVGLASLVSIDPWATKNIADSAVWLFLAPPPNVMRLVLLSLGAGIMVYATWRMRRLLHSSIETSVRNANLTRYLPAKLAPQLAAGQLQDLRRGQREEVAVLFVDIRGFTQLSEQMTPQQVSSFVTDFRTRIAQVVEAHDGIIDKFMGDAAMVLFIEPQTPARAAANGLACAADLQSAMQSWSDERARSHGTPVKVGIGLHFGTVFSGVVGDDTRLEYSVFGDTVNVAARLEEMSKELDASVLASRETIDAAGPLGNPQEWRHIAQTKLRGRHGSIDIMSPL